MPPLPGGYRRDRSPSSAHTTRCAPRASENSSARITLLPFRVRSGFAVSESGSTPVPDDLFPTDQRPCIPVRWVSGHQSLLGWRDVLLHAHEIEDLALPLPPAASAALRVLTAITARITDLDDPDMSAGEWADHRHHLLTSPHGGFDPDRIHAYFDQYTFSLYDPDRPFLQDPRLAHQCATPSGVNKLAYGRPEGNGLAWLSPHRDTDPQPLPSHQALWHLLIHHFYGAAGRCTPRTVDGTTRADAKAGPLRSTLSFHPLAGTLCQTLLAGLPPPSQQWPDADDACPWEEALPAPFGPQPPVTWPGRLLTGRSCHALLLVPDDDGSHTTDAYVTWATHHPQPALDPYLLHDVNTARAVPVTSRHRPRLADTDRALWRDLDALLLAGDETSRTHRPNAFTTLNDLPPEVRTGLRVRAHGFDQDPKTVNKTWYTALTPPIWPWLQDNNPTAAERLVECRIAAEATGALLDTVSRTAWKTANNTTRLPKTLTPFTRQARTAYWPKAETTFWHLLDHPDIPARPAFTTDAVNALRTATRAALHQQFRAAEAIACAIGQLRAGART
ncbi:type I-E CRISPR-associated protein Cse1/CasA [Streptomyces erythrochromogenes]|nr:type I-E CRISPR-associated protein Cse1/CasA [Streptomyces erythrochromogenes]